MIEYNCFANFFMKFRTARKRATKHFNCRKFARALRRDLSPYSDKSISQEEFARVIGVSWITIARWESKNVAATDDASVAKLKRLRKVVDELTDMIERDGIVPFLNERHPELLNCRPIDLLSFEDGFNRVMSLLDSISSGAFG